jgi:DNA-binding MarR family transcriptional regulator
MAAGKSQPRGRTSPVGVKLDIVLDALRVWEHRSFRRAADALGAQESTLSRHVRQLEDCLGVSLFERDGTGVRRRLRDPGDRRGVLAELTNKGRNAIDAIWDEYVRNAESFFSGYTTAELKAILRYLQRVDWPRRPT